VTVNKVTESLYLDKFEIILSVIMQAGKTQGLPGSIAGGAESFFGKNKGRTMDGILNKITTVVAILFVISSVALYVVLTK
jgi:preprotein translocase subunit SecG